MKHEIVEMTPADRAHFERAMDHVHEFLDLDRAANAVRIANGVPERDIESLLHGLELLALSGLQAYSEIMEILIPDALDSETKMGTDLDQSNS